MNLTETNFSSLENNSPNSLIKNILPKNIFVIAIVVFLVKLLIAAKTMGTSDMTNWKLFLNVIEKLGGADLYRNLPYNEADYNFFNFPPFVIQWIRFINLFATITNISFEFWFRFFSSLADFGSLIITYKILLQLKEKLPTAELILMTCAPISIMVSGFHGNLDPVFMFFILLSIYLIEINEDRLSSYLPRSINNYFIKIGITNIFLAGMIYGLSINIKIVPIIAAPCIFFYLANNKKRLEYFLAAGVTCIVLSIPYIFQVPREIIHSTFGYKSSYGYWGVSRILSSILPANNLLNIFYANQSKFLIIAILIVAALLMNFARKKVHIFFQVGFSFFIFLALSPGFGIQYLSWLVPWVLILGIEATLLYYLTSGIFAFMLYNFWSSGFPWNYALGFPYDNFIIKYEYIFWVSVLIITALYIINIARLKNIELDQYFYKLFPKQYFNALKITILFIISVMACYDFFLKKGFDLHSVVGETYKIREKRLFEISDATYSYYYTKAKLYQEAINFAQKALEANPSNMQAYNNMCGAYISMKEWAKVIEVGEKALEISPNDAWAKNNVNLAKEKLTLLGKISSTEDIINYLNSPPNDFTSSNFINISLELIGKGDNLNAIVACERAIEKDPNNAIAYNNLCIAYNNLFMYDEAELACKKSLELNPQFQLAKNNYDFTLMRKSDKTAPKATAENYINLGFSYINIGKFEKSVDLSEKALKLTPNNPTIYNNLCVAYNGLQVWDKAIVAAEQAIKIAPDFQLAKNNLAWAKSQKAESEKKK